MADVPGNNILGDSSIPEPSRTWVWQLLQCCPGCVTASGPVPRPPPARLRGRDAATAAARADAARRPSLPPPPVATGIGDTEEADAERGSFAGGTRSTRSPPYGDGAAALPPPKPCSLRQGGGTGVSARPSATAQEHVTGKLAGLQARSQDGKNWQHDCSSEGQNSNRPRSGGREQQKNHVNTPTTRTGASGTRALPAAP